MEFLEYFKVILENPFLAAFIFLYGMGWLLKHHTPLNNNFIPWVLAVAGMLMGFLLLENSLKGAIAGFAMGLFTVGAYEFMKNTARAAKGKKLN
ncbi:MAG: phage holin family protein [Peptococcaceae bacterium]